MNQTDPQTGAPPPRLAYRKTAPGTFMVDAGETYLGTVQEFERGEWWAIPAASTDTAVPETYRSRDAAAEALLTRHNRAAAPAYPVVDLVDALRKAVQRARENRTGQRDA